MQRFASRLRLWLRDLPVRLKGVLQRLDKLAIVLLYLCLIVLLPSVILNWGAGIKIAIALGLFFAANFLTLGALDLAVGRHQQAVRRLRGGLEAVSTRARPLAGAAGSGRRAILRSSALDANGHRHEYLDFVSHGAAGDNSELFPARVVIANSALQDKQLRIGDADAAPATEGVVGLRLSLTVYPDTSGRRLWLDQARGSSAEERRAVLIDGTPRPDYGQYNYIIVGTVSGDLRQPTWSNALMAQACRLDKKAAARIRRARIEWERQRRASAEDDRPQALIFAIRSPFQTAWDSGKIVVLVVGADERELAKGVARMFRASPPSNRIDITVAERSRWQQIQQSATERVPGAVAAIITIASMLVRSFFPGAVLALYGSFRTYTPGLTPANAAAVALGLLGGVAYHGVQEYTRLKGLLATAYTVYDDLAARAFWQKHDTAAAADAMPASAVAVAQRETAAAGQLSLAGFARSLASTDRPPLVVTGHNFHFQAEAQELSSPRSLLGMPIRIDTIDLILVAELLAALGLDRDEEQFRMARLEDITGAGGRTLCLTARELAERDLIILGSPRANALSNCLFRCGVDYRDNRSGFAPLDTCRSETTCPLRQALTAYAAANGQALMAPWVVEPEQVSMYENGERARSFGFPWHDNAGLLQLVDNPLAPGRHILLAHGYHRAGSDAAVAVLVDVLRGAGLPELERSTSVVLEYSSKEKKIECLYSL